MGNETRTRTATDALDLTGTRTSPGARAGGGLNARLERVSAIVGRGAGGASRRVGSIPDEVVVTQTWGGFVIGVTDEFVLPDGHLWSVRVAISIEISASIGTAETSVRYFILGAVGSRTGFGEVFEAGTDTLLPVPIAGAGSYTQGYGVRLRGETSGTFEFNTGVSGYVGGPVDTSITGDLTITARWLRPLTADELL